MRVWLETQKELNKIQYLNSIEKFFLKRILYKVLKQGLQCIKLKSFFKVLITMTHEYYMEDNKSSTKGFIEKCLAEAFKEKNYIP